MQPKSLAYGLCDRAVRQAPHYLLRWATVVLVATSLGAKAQESTPPAPREPEVLSIFPMGGRPGSRIQAEILGKSLEGAYAVWSEVEGITGHVRAVESTDLMEPKKGLMDEASKVTKGCKAMLTIEVGSRVTPGTALLRVLTPTGVSNALPFLVQEELAIDETSTSHGTTSEAQKITIPGVVNGKISRSGEIDLYAIEVAPDEVLIFEMISKPVGTPAFVSGGFSTAIALLEPSGSWFDEHQTTRLAYSDESVAGAIPTHSLLRYKLLKRGRYLVQAASFSNKGGPEYSYQLRIASAKQASMHERLQSVQAREASRQWQERSFRRRLDLDRLEQIWGRSLRATAEYSEHSPEGPTEISPPAGKVVRREPAGPGRATERPPVLVQEQEPNDGNVSVMNLALPVLVEGTIDRPGDVDSFKINVEKGQALAFEIETPASKAPLFNPKLTLLDENGREFLSNVFRRIARNFTFYAKTVQPKTVFTFELGGEYTLQIHDITSRVGNATCQYRLFVRPQIPHVGEIEVSVDRLNLVRGGSKKVNVTTGQEEGYAGEVAITVEGLPEGVMALPGTEVKPDRGINPDEGPKDRFLPKSETATLLFTASAGIPVTERPRPITILARPVVKGVLGPPLRSRQLLLMVVGDSESNAKP